MEGLLSLAQEAGVKQAIKDQFSGATINQTEGRAVLHMALRGRPEDVFQVDGKEVMEEVMDTRGHLLDFVDEVHAKKAQGLLTDVINIGIGGSDLGPAMACKALRRFASGPKAHFVSNVDGAHIESVLEQLDPSTTLVVVVSKTFTTQETMANAEIAKLWLSEAGLDLTQHLVAVSTNLDATQAFGVPMDRTFGFENWVGGRYSMWGPVGMCIALSVGRAHFKAFLEGARNVDQHVQKAELKDNLPVVLALLGHWNQNHLGMRSHAVIPYAEDLGRLPAYLQQADMESNGKSAGRTGEPVAWNTGAVVWGEPGTNSQHAFFQLLHQGTEIHPVDFIAFRKPTSSHVQMHGKLLANAVAQAEALLMGKDAADDEPHRHFPGNRPSTFFLFDELSPFSLGQLVALHEHRIFIQGVIWGIASFDQWGVELGKALANALLPELDGKASEVPHDASTQSLVDLIRG
jgi:glucose-6-phosphate isomerase